MTTAFEARASAMDLLSPHVPLRDRVNASNAELIIWMRRYCPQYTAEHALNLLVSEYDIAMAREHNR